MNIIEILAPVMYNCTLRPNHGNQDHRTGVGQEQKLETTLRPSSTQLKTKS